jgi:deoxyribodipyrimidine photolyase-like uncharacterized protein
VENEFTVEYASILKKIDAINPVKYALSRNYIDGHVHRDFFLKNPRLGMLVRTFDKMPDEKQKLHLNNAEQFLASL